MRHDIKKAQIMFKENIIGFLVWAYCDYYKVSAQEFDMRYGSFCYYSITKEKPKNYHSKTVHRVFEALSLNSNQAKTLFMFWRQLNIEGVFPNEKPIPDDIKEIGWVSHMLVTCRIIKPPEIINYSDLLTEVLRKSYPWIFNDEESPIKKGKGNS